MRITLVLTIFVLGVFVTTPVAFALSGPFVPLSSEQPNDDFRDSDQSDNERGVADSGEESSTSEASTSDQ